MNPSCSKIDFLGANKDWAGFLSTISQNTGNHYGQMWIDNAKSNKVRVNKCGWAAESLQDIHLGKTCVMLGASQAILKQIDRLKKLSEDPDFIFIGIASGLETLYKNDLKPKYMMIADADPAIDRFWENVDMGWTKGITLISNICVHPKLLKLWQGDIKYLAVFTSIEELDKKLKKLYRPINGIGEYFPALCSQYNTGAALAYLMLGCRIIIFVGNELSFPTEESTYYPNRTDVKDKWVRKPHPDIRGNTVYTNYMFMSLKLSLEDFLGKLPGWFFNATEAGIFGVSKRYGNTPWIHQFELDMAIAQAKTIMRTGQPLYSAPSMIIH